MGDEDIVLRPFEKPQSLYRRFQKPVKVKLKPIVEVPKPEAAWASWNQPSQASNRPVEQADSKPVVDTHAAPRAVGDNSPGLNLKHGFIRSIRHRINKNLKKESQDSKDKAGTSSDHLHVTGLKLCSSSNREDVSTTCKDVHDNPNTKLKTPTPGTNTVRTEAEPKRPVEPTPRVGVNQRVFGVRKSLSEAARSKSDTCLSVDTEAANTKPERPRRRRPSLQLYQPPGRRHQGADSVLGEIELYERRGMTSGDDDTRTASPLDPIMPYTATDPEMEGLGMPLRRTIAKTNLSNQTKITKQEPHTKNNLTVAIDKTRSSANSWSCKTNRRVFLSADSSVSKVSSLIECNGESSDTGSSATKPSTPVKTIDYLQTLKPDSPGSLVTNGSANNTVSSDPPTGDISEKFSYLEQMFQLDVTLSEVDVHGYPDWAQRYVFEAYHDPKLVSEEILAEIGRLIAERAWAEEEHDKYRHTAARLCQRIAKKEYDNEETVASVQSLPFQRSVLDGCFKAFQRRRLQTRDTWRTYATFCSDLLRRLHFGSVPPKILCTLVLNLLEQSTPTLLDSPAQVETVAEMLARCGPQLEVEHMARLERFIDHLVTNLLTSTDPVIKLNICLIQEMYAGGWFLSRTRRAYYTTS